MRRIVMLLGDYVTSAQLNRRKAFNISVWLMVTVKVLDQVNMVIA